MSNLKSFSYFKTKPGLLKYVKACLVHCIDSVHIFISDWREFIKKSNIQIAMHGKLSNLRRTLWEFLSNWSMHKDMRCYNGKTCRWLRRYFIHCSLLIKNSCIPNANISFFCSLGCLKWCQKCFSFYFLIFLARLAFSLLSRAYVIPSR